MSILDSFSGNSSPNNPASARSFSFTIQYNMETVHVEVRPDDPTSPKSLDAALQVYASALGFDFSRPHSWRNGPNFVPGTTSPEPGKTYVASVSHESKG